MAYETVLYDVADRICTITLNRPDKLNAWTRQMHLDLKDAMQTAGSDADVRAIILTGAGRGFCAGADMGGLQAIQAGAGNSDRSTKARSDLPGGSTLAEFRMNYSYFPAIPKFIIAAINGPAAGLGFVIPLALAVAQSASILDMLLWAAIGGSGFVVIVLGILLSNAMKFTPSGGSIDVTDNVPTGTRFMIELPA